MSESQVIKVKGDGNLKFFDNADTNNYEISFEQGDLQITPGGRAVNVFLDRSRFGANPSLRYGDDQESTFTFTANLRDAGADTSAATLTDILNWLLGSTQVSYVNSNWVPIGGANAEVRTVKLQWRIDGSVHGDGADHIFVLSPCVATYAGAEGDPTVLTINGRAFVPYPTVA
jgi:hypothetical protein